MNEQYKYKIAPKFNDYKVKRECTLLDFLMNDIPGNSRTKAKKLLSLKMVFVDKVITTQFDTPLKPGQIVQIAQKGNPHELRNKFVEIVYEDAFVIVVNKKEGIVSVPMPGTRENSVKSILDEYVKRQNKAFSVHTVHRLDKAVGGKWDSQCRVNLIRFHQIPDVPLKGADEKRMEQMRDYLNKHGITTTIRASRGQDIYAACGLLSTDRKKLNQ